MDGWMEGLGWVKYAFSFFFFFFPSQFLDDKMAASLLACVFGFGACFKSIQPLGASDLFLIRFFSPSSPPHETHVYFCSMSAYPTSG